MSVIRQYSVSTMAIALISVLLVSGGLEARQVQAQETRHATEATDSTQKTEVASKSLDPWFMLTDFSAVLIVRPADLTQTELLRPVPLDQLPRIPLVPKFSAEKLKSIEMVVVGMRPDDDLTTLKPNTLDLAAVKSVLFVRAVSPITDVPAFMEQTFGLKIKFEKIRRDGKIWWEGFFSYFTIVKLDDRTIGAYIGKSDSQRKYLLDNIRVSGPMADRVVRVDASSQIALLIALDRHHASLDRTYAKLKRSAPSSTYQIVSIAKSVTGMDIQFSLTGKALLKWEIDSRESTAAPDLKNVADEGVALLKERFDQFKNADFSRSPDAKPLVEFVDELVASIDVQQSERRTTIEIKQPSNWQPVVEALKPVIERAQAAAKRQNRLDILKQLTMSLYDYCEANESFPPAAGGLSGFYDAEGKRIHGWRTHLLPYLEQAELFDQLDPKSSWNSLKNAPFAGETPRVYISEGVNKSTGQTRFITLTGPQTVWPEKPLRFQDVPDGLSNTILFVEVPVEKAVPWTSTHDIPFNPDKPLEGIGKIPEDGLLVALCDGSVQRLRPDISAEVFKALVTPSGGEIIDLDEAFVPR